MEKQSDLLLLGSSNNLESIEKNKMADEQNSEAISATVKSDQINSISHGQKETDTKNINNNQINLQNDIFEITETPNTEKLPLTFEIFEPKKVSNRASPQNDVWGNANADYTKPDYTTGFTGLDANNNEIRGVNEDSHTRQASNTSTGSSTSGTQMSGNSNGQIGNGLMGSGQSGNNNFGATNNGFANNNVSDADFGFKSDTFETVKNEGFQSKLDFQPKNGGFSEFKPEGYGMRANLKDTSKDLWSMPKAEVRANDYEFKMSSWGNINEKTVENSVKDRQQRQPYPSNGSGSSSGSNGYQSGQHSFQNQGQNQGQNNFQSQQQLQQTQQQPQQHQQNGYGKFEAYGKSDAYPKK